MRDKGSKLLDFMKPLYCHYDDGFGAMARSFLDAGSAIHEMPLTIKHGVSNGYLPALFLLRHSIELHLKSICIIIARRYSGISAGEFPKLVMPDNSIRKMTSVHDLAILLDNISILEQDHSDSIKSECSNYTSVSSLVEKEVTLIVQYDRNSTYLRYPGENSPQEYEKSCMREISVDQLPSILGTEGDIGHFVIMEKNDNNEIVSAYVLDRKPLDDLRSAMKRCADELKDHAIGTYCEFAE